jgi:hypothetical protein
MLITSILGGISRAEGGIAKFLVCEIEPAIQYDVNLTPGQQRILTEMLLDYAQCADEKPRWEKFMVIMAALNFIEIHGEKHGPQKIRR